MTSVKPKLRAIEVIPFENGAERGYALRDPTGMASQTLAVSSAVIYILQRLDGAHDLPSIRREFQSETGFALSMQQLEGLIESLENAHFLEGPSYEAHREAMIRAYREQPVRKPMHAGEAYPDTPDALRDWYFSLEPKADTEFEVRGRLIGAAAPHIDSRFGGASCRLVHEQIARLRGDDLDTLVVLGTGHCAGEDFFTLTRQHYATPARTLETDIELVDALAHRLGEDRLLRSEVLHRNEHSIEFQAVFADLAFAGRQPPMLLPVLVGSFHEFVESGRDPWSDPRVRGFVETLQEELVRLGRRPAFLASIDLSHLGPRYGDRRGLTREEAARIEISDRELLRFAEDGDVDGYFEHNQAAKDERRVCGFAALYTLLRLVPHARGSLLRYEQTTFPHTEDTVAHCAMLFEEDE